MVSFLDLFAGFEKGIYEVVNGCTGSNADEIWTDEAAGFANRMADHTLKRCPSID